MGHPVRYMSVVQPDTSNTRSASHGDTMNKLMDKLNAIAKNHADASGGHLVQLSNADNVHAVLSAPIGRQDATKVSYVKQDAR